MGPTEQPSEKMPKAAAQRPDDAAQSAHDAPEYSHHQAQQASCYSNPKRKREYDE